MAIRGRPNAHAEMTKKNADAVKAGRQKTLPLINPVRAKYWEKLPKDILNNTFEFADAPAKGTKPREYMSADLIKYYYKLALSREWGVPLSHIRIYGCALPVITTYN